MALSQSVRAVERQVNIRHAGPPIGGAFASFALVIVAAGALAALQVRSVTLRRPETAGQLGLVGITAAGLAGLVIAYRGIRLRSRLIVVIAPGFLVIGGLWPWLTFLEGDATLVTHTAVIVGAGSFGVVLLLRGFRVSQWLESFSGLGFVAFVLAGVVARSDPEVAGDSPVLALLTTVGATVALYGALVDLEIRERRSMDELLASRQRIEEEVIRAEGILHDLRSGLLAIEAAIGSVDGELAAPLRAEAARLRRLTVRDERRIVVFDLVERVRDLVTTRRAAGLAVEFRAPSAARVVGDETEVLSIVENLLANAERHGRGSRVLVEITHRVDTTEVAVTNGGPGIGSVTPEEIFEWGTTTHPDGSGLGLSRSRMLAELNDAELSLRLSRDGCTTFALELRSDPELLNPWGGPYQ